jgi:hypothetical protein
VTERQLRVLIATHTAWKIYDRGPTHTELSRVCDMKKSEPSEVITMLIREKLMTQEWRHGKLAPRSLRLTARGVALLEATTVWPKP